ncbi:uncharacterized protein LOC111631361 [Centruroides sculpturatus]|uniref:uncharacterized protein LOC111631361 n=2 Tax=Centruroides sculpturatus TaxID=218467 RepID=UPI000C6DF662|nr:uncharacterized protein LOC111631361 [Centruroides sculpturatus]
MARRQSSFWKYMTGALALAQFVTSSLNVSLCCLCTDYPNAEMWAVSWTAAYLFAVSFFSAITTTLHLVTAILRPGPLPEPFKYSYGVLYNLMAGTLNALLGAVAATFDGRRFAPDLPAYAAAGTVGLASGILYVASGVMLFSRSGSSHRSRH